MSSPRDAWSSCPIRDRVTDGPPADRGDAQPERERPDAAVVAKFFAAAAQDVDQSIYRFVDLLSVEGVQRGLIGPREVPRLWSRHVLNCAVLAPLFPDASSVVDVGSGAGLPGLVVAIARPDLEVTLVEPLLRRTVFLAEVVEGLGLRNVEVVRCRAEELHGRRTFTSVTARAVAPLGRLVTWAWPLVRPGGELVAIKGAGAEAEVVEARPALVAAQRGWLRVEKVRIEHLGVGLLPSATTVVRIQSAEYLTRTRKGLG